MAEIEKIKVCPCEDPGELILLGHPNVGKSVIFGALTGKYVFVCNYPGTTVEVARGKYEGRTLVDAPGINSLTPSSEDEIVTRDLILEGKPSCLIQVGDARNLERTLRLTLQAAEFGLPMILLLNVADEALAAGIHINRVKLSKILGIPVLTTVAVEGRGINKISQAISQARVPQINTKYSPEIESAIEKAARFLPGQSPANRALSLMLLEGDLGLREKIRQGLNEKGKAEFDVFFGLKKCYPCRGGKELPSKAQDQHLLDGASQKAQDGSAFQETGPVGQMADKATLQSPVITPKLALEIPKTRAQYAAQLVESVSKKTKAVQSTLTQKIGQYSAHPFWGFLIMLGVLLGLYYSVGVFAAGNLVDFLEEEVFGEYLIPFFTKIVDFLFPVEFLREMLVGEYGQLTMGLTYALAIVLPIVAVYFLVFAILEDSGYLPRLSILLNRFFRLFGLNGKAVLPMILGLGCGTMAIMTARILDSRKERIIATLLLALAIPCSAQLGVIMGMLSAISAVGILWFIGMIISQLILVGRLAAMIIPGEKSDFIAEIPPFRVPLIKNILLKTSYRTEWFLREAVPIFQLGTLILFLSDRFHLIGKVEQLLTPVVKGWLGLPPMAAQSIVMGFLRRDFGAAGLFQLQKDGLLDPIQVVVSLVTVTLFVPCIASLLIMIKERGWKTGLAITGFVMPYAIFVGGILRMILERVGGL